MILNATPLSVAGRILQNRQILADKEPFRRHIYESVTLREFFDFKIKENAFLQGDTELVDKNILLRKMSGTRNIPETTRRIF